MAIPSNREEFIDYILRALGAPVIDINVDIEQVNDRIDEAISFYQMHHYDSNEDIFLLTEITQQMIDDGEVDPASGFITLPNNITSVLRVFNSSTDTFSGNFMSNIWEGMHNIMYDIAFGGNFKGCNKNSLGNYYEQMDNLANLQFTFETPKVLYFYASTHRLFIYGQLPLRVGDKIMIECTRKVDPDTFGDVFADRWLQKYAIALVGIQWGVNLSKFEGVQLPGGITLDGDKIYDRYNEIRLNLEEEFQSKYELPVDFMVG